MPVSEAVVAGLTSLVTKFALRVFFRGRDVGFVEGEDVSFVLSGGVDIAKDALLAEREKKNVARNAEEIADRVVRLLQEELDGESGPIDPNLVAEELCKTLDHAVTTGDVISPEELVEQAFDSKWLAAELRKRRQPGERELSQSGRVFYERAVDHTARYLVEMASLLPAFRVEVTKESLTHLRNIADTVEENARKLHDLHQHVTKSDSSEKEQEFEVAYRHAVQMNLDKVELFGARIPVEAQRNLLTDAFVSLNISRSGDGEDDDELLSCEDALGLLGQGASRMLIRGAAGGGKSTLMRWTAIQAARGLTEFPRIGQQQALSLLRNPGIVDSETPRSDESIVEGGTELLLNASDRAMSNHDQGSPQFQWLRRIPFFIPLRDFQDGQLPDLAELPKLIGKGVGKPPEDWVEKLLKAGKALLLIDGVDEVPPQYRGRIRDEITAVVNNYHKDNLLVLTTRPEAVPPDWLKSLDFIEARVASMPKSDVAKFIRQWHRAVGKKLASRGQPDDSLAETAEKLIDELDGNEAVTRLATNPLLCAMTCALYRDTRGKLPESAAELCESLCHMLLHKRERESGLALEKFPVEYRDLTYQHKRDIVQDLAVDLCTKGVSQTSFETARTIVAARLERIPGRSPGDASIVLESLILRSGMLREPIPEHVDFLHNTFSAFLAGEHFAIQQDADFLLSVRLFRPHTYEPDAAFLPIALFAAATGDFAGPLIQRMLAGVPVNRRQTRRKNDQQRARELMALRCQAVAHYLDPKLERRLKTLRERLLPPRNVSEGEAVAELGALAVPHLRYKSKMKASPAAGCIRALRTIGTRDALVALESFLREKESRISVLSELVAAVDPLRLPRVRNRVEQGAYLPDWVRPRITHLDALAGLSSLQTLNLSRCESLTDVSSLAGLSGLQTLNLHNCRSLTDVSSLAGLSGLQTLDLRGCGSLTDVSSLAGLSGLQTLHLSWCESLTDVSSLAGLSGLQTLHIIGTAIDERTRAMLVERGVTIRG